MSTEDLSHGLPMDPDGARMNVISYTKARGWRMHQFTPFQRGFSCRLGLVDLQSRRRASRERAIQPLPAQADVHDNSRLVSSYFVPRSLASPYFFLLLLGTLLLLFFRCFPPGLDLFSFLAPLLASAFEDFLLILSASPLMQPSI